MSYKTNKLFHIIGISTVGVLSLLSLNMQAATETTSFTVTATVTDVCQSLTAANIDFGSYNPLSASNTDASGNIQVTCTDNTSYSISLSAGGSGTYNTRQLNDGGANNLSYNLYTNSAYSTIWGDGSGSTSTVNETGIGSVTSTTVYARLPGSQSTPNGSYYDTINVTVTY